METNKLLSIIVIILAIVTGWLGYDKYNEKAKKQQITTNENLFKPRDPKIQEQNKIEEPPKNIDSYQAALNKAKSENKDVLLFFRMEHCPHCVRMLNGTFNDSNVKKKLDNFIVLIIDGEENPELAAKFIEKGYPSYFILDSSGNIKKDGVGYKGARTFLMFLNNR